MARYFQNQIVNPISNQYSPTTLKYMDEAGTSLQKTTDDRTAELGALQSLFPTGGAQTQNMAKELKDEFMPVIKDLSEELYKTGRVDGAGARMLQVKNQIVNNPKFNALKKDELMNPVALKIGSDPETLDPTQTIQEGYLPNKTWKQRTVDEIANQDSWYKTTKNSDFHKDHKADFYDNVKASVVKTGSVVPGVIYKDDGNGNPMAFNTYTEEAYKGILPEDVRARAADFVKNKDNWNTHGSVAFRQARAAQGGPQYDEQSYIDDLTNGYVGYYSEDASKTTEKPFTTGKKAVAGGGGGGSKNSTGNDDRTLNIIDVAVNQGGATVNNEEQAILHNGTPNANGTFNINATGKTIYTTLVTPKNQLETEQAIRVGKAIPLKNIINKVTADAEEVVFDEFLNKVPYSSNLPGVEPKEYVDPSGGSWHSSSSGVYYTPKNGEKVLVSKDLNSKPSDAFKKTKVYKNLIAGYTNNNEEYKQALADAKREGIDLNDPKLTQELDKYKESGLENLNTALTKINGQLTLMPGSEKNVFSDDEGNPVTSSDAFFRKDQIEKQIAPTDAFWSGGWKNLLEDGIIVPHTIYGVDNNGNPTENEGYLMKMVIPVKGQDWQNITRNIDQATWGEGEFSNKQTQVNQPEVERKIAEIKINKQSSKFNKQFSENPNQFITDWDKDFNDFVSNKNSARFGNAADQGYTEQQVGEINSIKVEAIEAYKNAKNADEKKAAKEILFGLHLKITNPQAYGLYFESLGKQEPQQTSSNPLGI